MRIFQGIINLKSFDMKKSLIFCAGALCILIASCSKDSAYDPEMDSSLSLDKARHLQAPVIVLPPSGDGDDTDEMLAAIASAEPGTVIQLLEGEYFTGIMEIYDFHGSLIGAGEGKTIITLKAPISINSQSAKNQVSSWWRLIDGDIVISGMTFRTPDGFPTEDVDPFTGRDIYSMFMINNYNDTYYHPYDSHQNVSFINTGFIGGTNTDMSQDAYWVTDHNIWLAIWIGVDYMWPAEGVDYPLTAGCYKIRGCSFEHFLDAVEGFSLGEEATIEVSGCKMNTCMTPLYFTANFNSSILIANNQFMNSTVTDITLEDADWGFLMNTTIEPIRRCQYNVYGNHFNDMPGVSSIVCNDYSVILYPEARLPMMINVKGNTFNMGGGGTAIAANNSQDAQIRNNRFIGNADRGVYLDGMMVYDVWTGEPVGMGTAENGLILGNNFTGLNTTEAHIVMGESSLNCTVVGNGKDNVIDLGTDNKIVGMNKMSGGNHAGPAIRDNFRMMPKMRGH